MDQLKGDAGVKKQRSFQSMSRAAASAAARNSRSQHSSSFTDRDRSKLLDDIKSAMKSSAAVITKPTFPRKAKQTKSKKSHHGMPRRPHSAYTFFCKAEKSRWFKQLQNKKKPPENSEFKAIEDAVEIGKAMALKWKKLSVDERKPYEKEAERDLDRYHQEMHNFNFKIVSESSEAAISSVIGDVEGAATEHYSSLSDGSSTPPSSDSGQTDTQEKEAAASPPGQESSALAMESINPETVADRVADARQLPPHHQQLLCSIFLSTLAPEQIAGLQNFLEQQDANQNLRWQDLERAGLRNPLLSVQGSSESSEAAQPPLDASNLLSLLRQLQPPGRH